MIRPVRVVHVLGTGNRSGSGIARTLENLARGLDPRRYSLSALFLRGDDSLPVLFRAAGLPASHARWEGTLTDPVGLSRFAGALMDASPAIVHFHAGARLHRSIARGVTRARIVAHYHSLVEETGGGAKRSLAGTDLVFANSRATAGTLPGGRAAVVYPGVRVAPMTVRRQSGPIVIGVATRLAPVKGLEVLLEALSLVALPMRDEVPAPGRRFTLEIAGEGAELDRLLKHAERLGIASLVRFLGWRNDVRDLMRRWTLYVQPSIAEGFGISVLEAMAEGLPVVATRVGGLAEVVLDGETGLLVPPGDAVGLSRAIARMCDDATLRMRMGVAGRERAGREFSIDREIAAIEFAYDRLLA